MGEPGASLKGGKERVLCIQYEIRNSSMTSKKETSATPKFPDKRKESFTDDEKRRGFDLSEAELKSRFANMVRKPKSWEPKI